MWEQNFFIVVFAAPIITIIQDYNTRNCIQA